jgi:HlyD family secretion protein
VDVLEVVADLEGSPPLLTGMRVDVFFKPTGKTAQNVQEQDGQAQ